MREAKANVPLDFIFGWKEYQRRNKSNQQMNKNPVDL